MFMGSAGKDAKSASASAGLAAAAKLRRTEVKLAAAALLAMFRVCDIGFADGDLFTANPTWATALIPIAANAAPQSAAMLLQASCMRQ